MNLLMNLDIYVVSILFLGIVLFNAYTRLDRRNNANSLFLLISLGILIGLVSEFITVFINGRSEQWLIPITKLFHVIIFTVCPTMAFLWYKFTNKWIDPDDSRCIDYKNILLIPLLFDGIISIISPFTNQVFEITGSNIYHRGPMFVIPTVCTYLYLFLSLLNVIKKRNKVINGEFFPLLLFGIIPSLGGALQLLFYGLRLLWPTAAFSIIIVYIYVQQRMMQIDTLTGAWTRGSFEQYLEKRLTKDKENTLGIIYIDLDDFKQINDNYGHLEGDIALKNEVELIKNVLSVNDIIARVGGDEFIILTENASLAGIEDLVNKIEAKFNEYNQTSEKRYSLRNSFGFDVFNSKDYTISQFINYVDHLMYSNKQKKS